MGGCCGNAGGPSDKEFADAENADITTALNRLVINHRGKNLEGMIAFTENLNTSGGFLWDPPAEWVTSPEHIASVALIYLWDYFMDKSTRDLRENKAIILKTRLIQKWMVLLKN